MEKMTNRLEAATSRLYWEESEKLADEWEKAGYERYGKYQQYSMISGYIRACEKVYKAYQNGDDIEELGKGFPENPIPDLPIKGI